MPKKGKDRRSDRDEAHGRDLAGGLGDEDYDWIKYLGEGRPSSAAAQPGSGPAAPPVTLPAVPPAAMPQTRPAAPRAARSAAQPLGSRQGASQEPGGAGRGRIGRRSAPAAARAEWADRVDRPDRVADYGADLAPRAGEDGLAVRPTTGRAVRLRPGQATDLQFNPAADDYRQPLYPAYDELDRGQQGGRQQAPQQGRPQRRRPHPDRQLPDPLFEQQPDPLFDRQRPGLDTAEYAQPLYPVQDTGPATAVRPRRSGPSPLDDPLADTDAGQQRAAGDRRLDRRPARPDLTDPGARVDRRPARPDLTDPGARLDQAGRQIRPAGLAGSAAPAVTAPGRAVRTGRRTPQDGFADLAQVADADGREWSAGVGASPEIPLLDRQLRYRGRSPRKPRKSGGQKKPRKQVRPGSSPAKTARRGPRKVLLAGGSVIVAVLAVAAYLVFRPQTAHAVSAPTKLGSYIKQQANATAMQLKHRIVAAAAGEVKNVVAAVYEQKTGPGTSAGPQIVVFIGGNLSGGTSASSLMSAFMARLHGAFTTSAGQLGGQAACAPGSGGGPAECAWADGDTFGVVVSATLTSAGLADEMRRMRPQVEHAVK